MDKVYRDTLDVEVALRSAMKSRGASVTSGSGEARASVSGPQLPGGPRGSRARLALKKIARPVVRSLYRLVRPVARPLAHRFRSFLLGNLQQEIMYGLFSSANEARSELVETRRELADIARELRLANKTVSDELSLMRAEIAEGTAHLTDTQTLGNKMVVGELTRIGTEVADSAKLIVETQARNSKLIVDELGRIPAEIAHGTSPAHTAISFGSGEVLVRTVVGFVLCPPNDPALLALLIETGDLEPGTRLLIERLVRPGDVFVDVGANIGMHTVAAARAMAGEGRIVAFEPFRPTWLSLTRTMWINGFSSMTTVHNAAASDRAGKATLHLGATSGHHSLFDLDDPAALSSEAVEVDLLTLDDVLGEDRVDVLKIDAEGAELDIVAGARSVLERNSEIAVIVEFGPSHLRRTGQTPQHWMSKFEEHGFAYALIDDATGALSPTTIELLQAMETANLFFARKDSSVWQRM